MEIVLKKFMPPLYKALGIYLPLITTNCAVWGYTAQHAAAIFVPKATLYGTGAGLGFTVALIIFSGIREKLELCDMQKLLKVCR